MTLTPTPPGRTASDLVGLVNVSSWTRSPEVLQAWDIIVADGMDDSFHHKGVFSVLERDTEEGKRFTAGYAAPFTNIRETKAHLLRGAFWGQVSHLISNLPGHKGSRRSLLPLPHWEPIPPTIYLGL